MSKAACIIIAGGKTGGHLFPGIAVADALQRMSENVQLLFVGTNAPFEEKTLSKYGFDHRAIYAKPLKGGSIISKTVSIFALLFSLLQALFIMMRVRPKFVLGVGGFSSFAVVVASWILRIPRGIQEQNAFPGLTNRMLARFTQVIFTSFKNTKGLSSLSKTRYVGNPVRRMENNDTVENSSLKNYDSKKFTLLVTGGSQGAKSINTAFIDAVQLMGDAALEFNIIHQTGAADEHQIRERYSKMNTDATAKAFFHDMPKLQDMADLVITRAGAGTLSELCIKGKPAILVPYPYAADDHQAFNAKALEDQGAAIMIKDNDLDGQIIKKSIETLSRDKSLLEKMSKNLKDLAMPDADEKIAGYILETIQVKG